MTAPAVLTPTPRVQPHLGHAFGGVWRLTFRRFANRGHLLYLIGLSAVLTVLTLASVRAGKPGQYWDWVGGFYLTLLVPVMAFLSGAGAIRDELKAGTVDYVFTRSLRRDAFVVFKYASHLACLQISYGCALVLLVALGAYRQIPDVLSAWPLLLFVQFTATAAFAAMGLFCGLLTSRYLVVGVVYGGVIEIGVGVIPTSLNRLAMTHHVRAMLAPFFRGGVPPVLDSSVIGHGCVLLLTAVGLLAAAALYFHRQELTGAAANDA
jgi:ABC-2 type transport system permease protein